MSDQVYKHVSFFGKGSTRKIYCKYCDKQITARSKLRWVQHLRGCEKVSEEVKLCFKNKKREVQSVLVETKGNDNMNSQISEHSVFKESGQPAKRTMLNSYFDTINKDDIKKIDKSYARIFFHTGVPFALADSSAWKQHHANLRPAYKPPSSKCISGRLYKDALNNEKCRIKEYVDSSEYVSIVTDGFSNINANHLINYSIHVENRTMKPIAYKIEPTGQEQQTGINIAKRIENVILEVGVDKVTSIVTDNASNMRAAWDIIERKYPNIFCNGCAAHTINLLVKDICLLPEFVDILEKSEKLTAFVKQRTSLVDQFRIIQNRVKQENNLKEMRTLSHAVLTRWYSHHTSVARNLENKLVHLNLVNSGAFSRISPSTKKSEYINIVQDEFFWENCQCFINVMKPLSKLVGKLESDSCLLSEVYIGFINLMQIWCEDSILKSLVLHRWEFIHTPSMGFAYFLDPRNHGGRNMYNEPPPSSKSDLVMVLELLPKYIVETRGFCNYQTSKKEIKSFQRLCANPTSDFLAQIELMDPDIWWGVEGASKFPNLAKVARIVFTIPTSQAASERIWSLYDFIHSKRRNRLAKEKAIGLVLMYANATLHEKEANIADIMLGNASDHDNDEDDVSIDFTLETSVDSSDLSSQMIN